MSGNRPEIPDELHILAGEYVLGALEAAEMRAVRQRAATDPHLAAAIAGWERRLAPLSETVPPHAPPRALWNRLEQAIAEVPDADTATAPPARRPLATAEVIPLVPRAREPVPAARRPGRIWPWQLATVASLAVAAGVLGLAYRPSLAPNLHILPPPPQVAALMPADAKPAGYIVQARADGAVVLTALSSYPVPAGRDLELWILRPGAGKPGSLGVLPAGGTRVTLPGAPPPGTQLLISLEPAGGSPTGQPTGPVLFAGALSAMAL